jgi:hypothetical protein
MKQLIIFACFCLFATGSYAQQTPAKDTGKEQKLQTVEASCGQCQFNLPGKGCDLAVRIDGKAYFVDGTKIDDHGDAHAKDGFCQSVRKAEVKGEVIKGRFKATSFKLLPEKKTE